MQDRSWGNLAFSSTYLRKSIKQGKFNYTLLLRNTYFKVL